MEDRLGKVIQTSIARQSGKSSFDVETLLLHNSLEGFQVAKIYIESPNGYSCTGSWTQEKCRRISEALTFLTGEDDPGIPNWSQLGDEALLAVTSALLSGHKGDVHVSCPNASLAVASAAYLIAVALEEIDKRQRLNWQNDPDCEAAIEGFWSLIDAFSVNKPQEWLAFWEKVTTYSMPLYLKAVKPSLTKELLDRIASVKPSVSNDSDSDLDSLFDDESNAD
ncbi:hypothetical protein VKT23_016911 [Stygiomarasmius scandens]|uniref:Uncharacterized protein n=1 Tax=Marasmiellus scandens TaxID=2682957 RepID=A0ABR1IX42_9AGAR